MATVSRLPPQAGGGTVAFVSGVCFEGSDFYMCIEHYVSETGISDCNHGCEISVLVFNVYMCNTDRETEIHWLMKPRHTHTTYHDPTSLFTRPCVYFLCVFHWALAAGPGMG